jgi:hypothetical protein
MANTVFGQNLDSLYNQFVSLHSHRHDYKANDEIKLNQPNIKCAFTLYSEVKQNLENFSFDQQNTLKNILARPQKQKSIISPSGVFRIHFDTTGTGTPNYFPGNANNIQLSVDSLAIAFDSAYTYEINYLEYNAPPKDDGAGGDDLFDVYIINLGYYGVTEWNFNSNGENASFIRIDNSMNFFTTGINAARATAAHEFHHAVQVGGYSDNIGGNQYYYEITSTAMEEFVYPEVNDYLGYISGYFYNPDRRFTYFDGTGNGGGYDRAIWNIFLREKFLQEEGNSLKGQKIIKRSWELMRNDQNSAIQAISLALSENGLSLKNTFAEFAQWAYYTNYRTQDAKYFPEAKEYPLIKYVASYEFAPPKKTYMMKSEPLSNNFLIFDLSSSGINDTLVSIISNCDLDNADQSSNAAKDYSYSLLTVAEDGSNEIVPGYYSNLQSDDIGLLKETNIFNNKIVNGTPITREEIDFAYPQPFNPLLHPFLSLPTTLNKNGLAKLTVYGISGTLIYNSSHQIINGEKIVIHWDGKTNNGNKVASGIYIFVTDSDGDIIKGKIAIIN